MIKIILQLLLIAVVGVGAYIYFGLVLPPVLAGVIATGVAVVALFGMLAKSGLAFDSLMLGGPVLAAWPAGALLIDFAGQGMGFMVSPAVAQAGAFATAAVAGQVSFSLAEKRDRARDAATLGLSAIVLYGIIVAILSGERGAIAVACLGVAAAAIVARQQMILPPTQERALMVAAMVAAMAATLHLLFSFIG